MSIESFVSLGCGVSLGVVTAMVIAYRVMLRMRPGIVMPEKQRARTERPSRHETDAAPRRIPSDGMPLLGTLGQYDIPPRLDPHGILAQRLADEMSDLRYKAAEEELNEQERTLKPFDDFMGKR